MKNFKDYVFRPNYNQHGNNNNDNKDKAATYPEKKTNVLDDFLGRTTIGGISHINGHKSIIWKLIWLVVFILGLLMAMINITWLVIDYRS